MANKIPRVPVREQDPAIRATNFEEVCYGYNQEEAMLEATRCLDCKNPRCVAACPVGIQIPRFIERLREGDVAGAAALREEYKGKKIIFSLGRLVSYKGYKYLIDSARHLDDSYVILIGGGGPLKTPLREQIENSGLQDKVKLLGFLSDAEVSAYFGACDLFCMSSVYATEAFGIVQIEAMSAGKPVVATKIPGSGVSWVNAHKESGLNVEPKDSEALADAFMHILESEDDYQHFAEQAQQRYWTMFTKSKMIEKCVEIYKSL